MQRTSPGWICHGQVIPGKKRKNQEKTNHRIISAIHDCDYSMMIVKPYQVMTMMVKPG